MCLVVFFFFFFRFSEIQKQVKKQREEHKANCSYLKKGPTVTRKPSSPSGRESRSDATRCHSPATSSYCRWPVEAPKCRRRGIDAGRLPKKRKNFPSKISKKIFRRLSLRWANLVRLVRCKFQLQVISFALFLGLAESEHLSSWLHCFIVNVELLHCCSRFRRHRLFE